MSTALGDRFLDASIHAHYWAGEVAHQALHFGAGFQSRFPVTSQKLGMLNGRYQILAGLSAVAFGFHEGNVEAMIGGGFALAEQFSNISGHVAVDPNQCHSEVTTRHTHQTHDLC